MKQTVAIDEALDLLAQGWLVHFRPGQDHYDHAPEKQVAVVEKTFDEA